MELQAKMLRTKAKRCREAGDMEGSKLNMRTALQYQKWASSTEAFKIKLEGIQHRVEQGQYLKDFNNIAHDIAGVLKNLQTEVNEKSMNEMLDGMDVNFEKLDNVMETTGEKLDLMNAGSTSAVTDEEVENALAEMDSEISVKRGEDLPETPVAGTDSQIENLEEEIKKLKQQRT